MSVQTVAGTSTAWCGLLTERQTLCDIETGIQIIKNKTFETYRNQANGRLSACLDSRRCVYCLASNIFSELTQTWCLS